ncbi:MAG TPA: DNA repair protein RecO [Candidatus Moranbacteria bacterium]|nr:DNA repair protein RecO [Candidatus Moranbacteria bacterium]HAT74841.1 DNA repair protein RecO [Candidatus Moranbacteria bacterium]
MDFKYSSIILSKRDLSETDRIYNFYSLEEGKIQAVGRGVKKPNAKLAGNLESLTFSEIFVSRRKGLGNITGAIAMNNFLAIKENFSATSRVFWVFSYFDKLVVEQEKDEKVFGMFLEYLETMEKLSAEKKLENKLDIVSVGFLFKLAQVLGYKIAMEYCVVCEKKTAAGNNNFFSAERGGALCGECGKIERKKIRNSDSSIKLVRIFLKNKTGNFSKLEVPEKDLRELKLIWRELAGWI